MKPVLSATAVVVAEFPSATDPLAAVALVDSTVDSVVSTVALTASIVASADRTIARLTTAAALTVALTASIVASVAMVEASDLHMVMVDPLADAIKKALPRTQSIEFETEPIGFKRIKLEPMRSRELGHSLKQATAEALNFWRFVDVRGYIGECGLNLTNPTLLGSLAT